MCFRGIEGSVLHPLATTLKPLPLNAYGEDLPLGTSIWLDLQGFPLGLGYVLATSIRWPWVPIVVPWDSTLAETELLVAVPALRRLAFAVRGGSPTSSAIRTAVARRPPPNPAIVVDYLCSRARALCRVREVMLDQFRSVWQGDQAHLLSYAAYSRIFSRAGDLTAHDWRALYRLVMGVASLKTSNAGNELRTTARTLNRYAMKYLGKTLVQVRELAGWEWILESVLRSRSLVGDHGLGHDAVVTR
jgi:hypothetical protein